MSPQSAVQPAALATAGQVAAFLGGGFSEKTLANWRSAGKGPKYRKVGGSVRYAWSDVQAWLDEQSRAGAA
jgi:predicted DNA-binding transcriptional regulator AlpA